MINGQALIVTISTLAIYMFVQPGYADPPEEAVDRLQKGRALWEQGECAQALNHLEEALRIGRLGDRDQTQLLKAIGDCHACLLRIDKAMLFHANALQRALVSGDVTLQGLIMADIGDDYANEGQLAKALTFYTAALERDLSEADAGEIKLKLGFLLVDLRQYDKALKYFTAVEQISLESSKRMAMDLMIANIEIRMGQFEKALSRIERCLVISRTNGFPEQHLSAAYMVKGFLYYSLGDYSNALFFFKDSLAALNKSDIGNNVSAEPIKQMMGYVYLSMKNYKEAEAMFSASRSAFGLIELFIATSQYDKALALLDTLQNDLRIAADFVPEDRKLGFQSLYGLALSGKGRFQEASRQLVRAVLKIEEFREKNRLIKNDYFLAAGQDVLRAGFTGVYRGLVAALCSYSLKGVESDEYFSNYGEDMASAAFYFAESTKARTLLEGMAESARTYDPQELPSELRAKELDILNQLDAVERNWEAMYKQGGEAFKQWSQRKESLNKDRDALIEQLRKEYPKYTMLMYPKPLAAESLPLEDNEVLLEYSLAADASYLFKVRKGAGVEKIIRIPKGKEEIEQLVTEFMNASVVSDPCGGQSPSSRFPVDRAKVLYDLLLSEAMQGVSREQRAIIVPDGMLGALPFEALVVTPADTLEKTVFVQDLWEVSYAQSATVLAMNRMLPASGAQKPLFALGNPIFSADDSRYVAHQQQGAQQILLASAKTDDTATAERSRFAFRALATHRDWGKTTKDDPSCEISFSPLPSSETEIAEIVKLWQMSTQPPDVLLGIDASETQLRAGDLKNYRYLHFATHAAAFSKVQGIKEPFLVLGQVENKKPDDGLLTLSEVLNLKLNADMVVLSACETGRGAVVEGEGVANFARAFHYAGARSVVVSLWQVADTVIRAGANDDYPALDYMRLFYSYVKQGDSSRSAALRKAKSEMKRKYPHPFYWAVLIMYG